MTSAIKTITIMVLISLQPFVLQKLVLIVAALLFFSAFCFADPVFMTSQYAATADTALHVGGHAGAHARTKREPSAVQIGLPAQIAASEIALWQSLANPTDPLIVQLTGANFSDLNSYPASDLTTFQ